MGNTNEYIEDRRYLLKTLERIEQNIEKLFENDRKREVELGKLDTKIVVWGSVAGIVTAAIITIIVKYI